MGGFVVFDVSQKYLQDPQWIDLMNNVAASLFAVPLVFLFYDYSHFLVTRRVQKHQHTNLVNALDGCLLKILHQIENIIRARKLEIPIQDINLDYKKLDLNVKYFRVIKKQLKFLEDLLYKSDKIDVLDSQHTQILSFIAQNLNQIMNEYKYHNSRREIAKYIETTLSMINDWFYSTGYTSRKNMEEK
nr:hypothetical protein [Candidatus Enterousia merdequi]